MQIWCKVKNENRARAQSGARAITFSQYFTRGAALLLSSNFFDRFFVAGKNDTLLHAAARWCCEMKVLSRTFTLSLSLRCMGSMCAARMAANDGRGAKTSPYSIYDLQYYDRCCRLFVLPMTRVRCVRAHTDMHSVRVGTKLLHLKTN